MGFIKYFFNFIKKTISFKSKLYTIRVLIEIFIFIIMSKILSIKFILLILLNIIILYDPLEKKCPHFLFKFRMSFRQIIEGLLSLIVILII